MLDLIFWIAFLLTPILMVSLLRLAGEQLNQISMVNVTTVSLYAFSVLGTFPLFYMLDAYRVSTGIVDQGLILKVLLLSSINMVLFLLGVIFGRRALRLKPVLIRSCEISYPSRRVFVALTVLLFVVVLVLFVYLSKINQVALFVALKDGAAAAMLARSKMGNDFDGKYHWYSLVLHNMGTVITIAFYVAWLKKKNILNFIILFIAFSISSFVALMATEKEPFIGLLMALFMAYYLTKHDGFVPKTSVVTLGLMVVAILAVFYMYFMGSRSIGSALWSVFSRAFSGSIAPAYFYLEYFPAQSDYLMGLTFPNPGGIMPFEPVRFTVDLMNWKFPYLASSGVVGSMPTVFWGEAYVNFGFAGVPLVAFIMGVFVSAISYIVSKLELNPLTIAFTVWIIFHIKSLAVTGFSGFLYDFYLILTLIVVVTILFMDGRIKIRKRQSVNNY